MSDFAGASKEWCDCLLIKLANGGEETEKCLLENQAEGTDLIDLLADNTCANKPNTTPSALALGVSNFATSGFALTPGHIFASSSQIANEWKCVSHVVQRLTGTGRSPGAGSKNPSSSAAVSAQSGYAS